VTAPDFPLREAAALRLSLPAWIRLAVIGYWGAAGLFCVYIVLQRWRLPLLRTATGLCILFAVSLAAAWVWLGFYYQPEVVVTAPNVKALFAPLENSTAHFALPAGALVRTEETSGNWIKIAYDKQSGWIPQTACQPVFDAAFLKHSSLP